jgi:hypothetical protein
MGLICHACGQEVESSLPEILNQCGLTVTERRVCDIVLRTPNLSRVELSNRMYEDDEDGGPDLAECAARQHVHNINKKLRPLGWELTGLRGQNGYRFLRVPK